MIPPTSIINQEDAPQANLVRAFFFQLKFSLPYVSSLCPGDIKLACMGAHRVVALGNKEHIAVDG